jgi:hypothetical protein
MAKKGPKVNAEPKAPDQDEAEMERALHRLFGTTEGTDLEELIPRLIAHDDVIQAWLDTAPENAEAFARDPVNTLRNYFPTLEMPAAGFDQKIGLGDGMRIAGATAAPDPAALALFVRVWNYLGTSEENVTGFRTNPVGVITFLGQDQPPRVVSTVMNAFGVSVDQGISLAGRFVRVVAEKALLGPGGPVQASVVGEIAVVTDVGLTRGR